MKDLNYVSYCIIILVLVVYFRSYLVVVLFLLIFFFFFQAEDGIRDKLVTGVQTCALPIYRYVFHVPYVDQVRLERRTELRECSPVGQLFLRQARQAFRRVPPLGDMLVIRQIGRASCRERV